MSCDYLAKLDPIAGTRYRQKIAILDVECPYTLPSSVWKNNSREWPPVEYEDVFHYLIKTPGVYTGEEMGNYKSVRSKNLLMSGWVQQVYHHKVASTSVTLFKADVIPSYRVNDTPHHPWVAVATDGAVITGHCDCKAGLGESCTHVGGLLHKIEMTCRMGLAQTAACTDIPCAWSQVEWSGVKPACLVELDFYSAEAKKAYKEKKNEPKMTTLESRPPTEEEKDKFLISLLASHDTLPVGLCHFSTTAGNFVSNKPAKPIRKVPRPLKQLVQQGGDILLRPGDLDMVEEVTRKQASSITWHEQRVGRITSSVAHSALHTNPQSPAKSLILKICCMSASEIKAKPLQWGREHEKDAIEIYVSTMTQMHTDFKYKQCGLFVHPTDISLAASPDGLVSCECCGSGVVEAKCPYNLRELDQEQWPNNSCFPLDQNSTLPTKHPHFTQVQHHMFVTNRAYCDYIIWAPKATMITRVEQDKTYEQISVPKLRTLWEQHIKPELLYGKLEGDKYQKDDDDKENRVYCICGKIDDTQSMVGCDNDDCQNKWFHWGCVGLAAAPRTKTWYCTKCRPVRASKRQRVAKKVQ